MKAPELFPDERKPQRWMRARALTLYEPWASAIARGLKSTETRGWSTPYRGPLLIHAGKADVEPSREVQRVLYTDRRMLGWTASHTRGAIVALVQLVDVVPTESVRCSKLERALGNYEPGRYGWVLTEVRRFNTPIFCRGAMGLWTPVDELQEQIARAELVRVPASTREQADLVT